MVEYSGTVFFHCRAHRWYYD